MQTARRLSIYVAPVNNQDEESDSSESDDDDSDQGDRDDEGMMDQGDDDGYGDLADSDDEQDDEDEGQGGKGRIFDSGKAGTTRRIRVGPPQNSDTSGRKVPPQVTCQELSTCCIEQRRIFRSNTFISRLPIFK